MAAPAGSGTYRPAAARRHTALHWRQSAPAPRRGRAAPDRAIPASPALRARQTPRIPSPSSRLPPLFLRLPGVNHAWLNRARGARVSGRKARAPPLDPAKGKPLEPATWLVSARGPTETTQGPG